MFSANYGGLNPQICAVIPTYNEPDMLRACLESLEQQGLPMHVRVVNAGSPLEIPGFKFLEIEVIQVPGTAFWTECMDIGTRDLPTPYALLSNADTVFLPGCIEALLSVVAERTVACSAAYFADGTTEYTDQAQWGALLFGKILRRWPSRSDAPEAAVEIELTGGQGVLVPAAAFHDARWATRDLPQYASDHDFWLQLRRKGWCLALAPQAGISNARPFGLGSKGVLHRLTSLYAAESAITMWRLRRRNLPFPLAILSWLVSFTLRWTLGLPGILRRR